VLHFTTPARSARRRAALLSKYQLAEAAVKLWAEASLKYGLDGHCRPLVLPPSFRRFDACAWFVEQSCHAMDGTSTD
jgi:hypothetical protein